MSLRKGIVFWQGSPGDEKLKAGFIEENEDQYCFYYLPEYLADPQARAVSLTLPLRAEPYKSERLFSFFDGLIPEGWLLETAQKNWKLNNRDRMGLLLACCKNTIGAVTVEAAETQGAGELV